MQQTKRDQLNYSIEKNLLKETYSNNYSTISLVITFGLGLIGIFAYLGLRDINAIKKEYNTELQSLRSLKTEFEIKLASFNEDKKRFDLEIKDIVKQNEEQNKRIKILEIREKALKAFNNNENANANDYATIGLELSPDDVVLLDIKAKACCRLNELKVAIEAFNKIVDLEPEKDVNKLNQIECLFMMGEITKAKAALSKITYYRQLKELTTFFTLFDFYHTKTLPEMRNFIRGLIDGSKLEPAKKYFESWQLTEALHFAHLQPESPKKELLQKALWYLDAQITGRFLLNELNKVPETEGV